MQPQLYRKDYAPAVAFPCIIATSSRAYCSSMFCSCCNRVNRQNQACARKHNLCTYAYHDPLLSVRVSCCLGCYRAWYCGRQCQKTHWRNGHAHACIVGLARSSISPAALDLPELGATTIREQNHLRKLEDSILKFQHVSVSFLSLMNSHMVPAVRAPPTRDGRAVYVRN
jgi:hypothetical protein